MPPDRPAARGLRPGSDPFGRCAFTPTNLPRDSGAAEGFTPVFAVGAHAARWWSRTASCGDRGRRGSRTARWSGQDRDPDLTIVSGSVFPEKSFPRTALSWSLAPRRLRATSPELVHE